MSWPLIQERYKSGIYQQYSRKPFLSSSSLMVILEWSPTDTLHFDTLWYITNISLLTLLSLDILSFLGMHAIPFFWNFHSFLSPLYLLCRCLFCLFLNKRALQVYSSRSFHSVCVCVCVCVCARTHTHMHSTKSLQLCPTLCNPMDHSLPGSSNHGILQVRILEWVAMPSSRLSSWPRNRTHSLTSPTLAGTSLPLASPGKPSFYSTPTQTLYICR